MHVFSDDREIARDQTISLHLTYSPSDPDRAAGIGYPACVSRGIQDDLFRVGRRIQSVITPTVPYQNGPVCMYNPSTSRVFKYLKGRADTYI